MTATMFSATGTYVLEKCNLKVSKDSWQLGKTAVVKLGAYIVSADRKKPYTVWNCVKRKEKEKKS